MESSSKKGALDQLPPRFAFWAGVVTSAAVFAVVGFIIMIALTLGGDGTSKTSNTNRAAAANTNAAAPAAAPSGAAAAPAAGGSVDLASLTNIQGEGDITIIEYSDLECPFCERFHPTLEQVVADFDGQVRWAYKHFPLTSIHPNATRAAEASECAAEQGLFWEYTDYLFDNQSTLGSGGIDAGAEAVGLNTADFTECLDSGKYTDVVAADAAEAQSLGGQGTPFSVIVDSDGNVLDRISGALPLETVTAQLETHIN